MPWKAFDGCSLFSFSKANSLPFECFEPLEIFLLTKSMLTVSVKKLPMWFGRSFFKWNEKCFDTHKWCFSGKNRVRVNVEKQSYSFKIVLFKIRDFSRNACASEVCRWWNVSVLTLTTRDTSPIVSVSMHAVCTCMIPVSWVQASQAAENLLRKVVQSQYQLV